MTADPTRKLKVFLCHSSHDKPVAREIYTRLKAEGWIDPWLDEEKLFPGQDWDLEIEKAVEETDAVLVFLSDNSVNKEGYIQKELRFVLNMADYKPEGTNFVLPFRLNECPLPRRLRSWHYVDNFPEERKEWAYGRLLGSLKLRAKKLGIDVAAILNEKIERQKEELAEKKRKEQAEKDRKEKAAREAAEKAEQERIAKEKREVEEKARLEKEAEKERERKAAAEKKRQEKKAREKRAADEKARKTGLRKERQRKLFENSKMFFGGMSVLMKSILGLGIVMVLSLIYIFSNIDSLTIPEPTETLTTSVPATATTTLKLPTSIFTPTVSSTPVIAVATDTLTATPNTAATGTVAAALTQAAMAVQTVLPTQTSFPDGGFTDDIGIPGLLAMLGILFFTIFFARRLRRHST